MKTSPTSGVCCPSPSPAALPVPYFDRDLQYFLLDTLIRPLLPNPGPPRLGRFLFLQKQNQDPQLETLPPPSLPFFFVRPRAPQGTVLTVPPYFVLSSPPHPLPYGLQGDGQPFLFPPCCHTHIIFFLSPKMWFQSGLPLFPLEPSFPF